MTERIIAAEGLEAVWLPIGSEATLENVIRKPVVAFVTNGEDYLPLVRLCGVHQVELSREHLIHSSNGQLSLASTITNPEGAETHGADFLGVARNREDILGLLPETVNRKLDQRASGDER